MVECKIKQVGEPFRTWLFRQDGKLYQRKEKMCVYQCGYCGAYFVHFYPLNRKKRNSIASCGCQSVNKNRRIKAGTVQNMKTLYEDGYSIGEIGRKLTVEPKTVKNRLERDHNLIIDVRRPRKEQSSNWTGYKEISGTYWSAIRRGAESRGITHEITIREVWDLFLTQDKKCALTGQELIMYPKSEQTASLDRIDPNLGYTIHNVHWVHKKINMFKNSYNNDEFIQMCHMVSNHNPIPKE